MRLKNRSSCKVALRLRKALASLNLADALEIRLLELSSLEVQAFLRDLAESDELALSAPSMERLLSFCRTTPDQGKRLDRATKVQLALKRFVARKSSLPETLSTYVYSAKIITAPR